MTQKQIEIETQNYLKGLDLPENADKQLIVDNFKNGMAWALMLLKEEKQQWIEKACKLMQHWILEHDYVDIMELEDYIKQKMDDL